jgi:hypothetical protein
LITRVDGQLREQVRRFVFRFACDDCAHFGATRGDKVLPSCSLGYPASPRKDAMDRADVEFCKSFEVA